MLRKVEVETLDWAKRVTNYHVLKSWGRNLGLSWEVYELSRVEKLRSKPWTEPRGLWTITCWKIWGWNLGLSREGYELSRVEKLRLRPWTESRGLWTITCWKVEVETLDWDERFTNYHVLKSWGWDLGLSREGYELSCVEKLRLKSWTQPRGSRHFF